MGGGRNDYTDEKQNHIVNTSQVTLNSQIGASNNTIVTNNKQSIMSFAPSGSQNVPTI